VPWLTTATSPRPGCDAVLHLHLATKMPALRSIRAAVLAALPLFTGCAPSEEVADGTASTDDVAVYSYTVQTAEGTDSILSLPQVAGPPGAPVCPAGSNANKRRNFAAGGGTIEGPPEFVRPASLTVSPLAGADTAPFHLIEPPSLYPEVKAVGPARRPVRIMVSARGCTYSGTILLLYERVGSGWDTVPGATVGADSSVSADLPSLQSRFALGTN
jgi:hypothetical protein